MIRLEVERARAVFRVLMDTFRPITFHHARLSPFELLVATVLSQHTNDRNSERAFDRLRKAYSITPLELAAADEVEICGAIKPAGLQTQKARTLIALSKAVLERYEGNVDRLLVCNVEEARERLMELPGVGPKTADVLLLFGQGAATFPIDTHISRVSRRLGLVEKKSSYEEMRRKLQGLFPSGEYKRAHLLLIMLGRRFCTAARPRHDLCPVRCHCPMIMETDPYGRLRANSGSCNLPL